MKTHNDERRSGHQRIKSYRIHFGNGSRKLEEFSKIQADSFGTVLETDGVPIAAAIRMVDQWNRRASLQGNALRYSIPFIAGN